MEFIKIDPLQDGRWRHFVDHHPRASIFHHVGWLGALYQTYGHKPYVLTTAHPDEPLEDGLVFSEVKSWLTGKRLVSLPFSDHCDILADSEIRFEALLKEYSKYGATFDYAEIRPLNTLPSLPSQDWHSEKEFVHHSLSLEPSLDSLFGRLHKSCIQRKVRKAEKEGLQYAKGNNEALLQQFYQLHMCTRRRHGVPPQPLQWFRSLVSNLSERLTIRIASQSDRPIAAILTLSHRQTCVYKYGCSDEQHHRLGAMPFLFWRMIEECKIEHFAQLDFGRTDLTNEGLISFKDRFGAVRTRLPYLRYPGVRGKNASSFRTQFPIAGHIFSKLPEAICWRLGELLYRHMD